MFGEQVLTAAVKESDAAGRWLKDALKGFESLTEGALKLHQDSLIDGAMRIYEKCKASEPEGETERVATEWALTLFKRFRTQATAVDDDDEDRQLAIYTRVFDRTWAELVERYNTNHPEVPDSAETAAGSDALMLSDAILGTGAAAHHHSHHKGITAAAQVAAASKMVLAAAASTAGPAAITSRRAVPSFTPRWSSAVVLPVMDRCGTKEKVLYKVAEDRKYLREYVKTVLGKQERADFIRKPSSGVWYVFICQCPICKLKPDPRCLRFDDDKSANPAERLELFATNPHPPLSVPPEQEPQRPAKKPRHVGAADDAPADHGEGCANTPGDGAETIEENATDLNFLAGGEQSVDEKSRVGSKEVI